MKEETYGWNLEMLMRVAAAAFAGAGDRRRAAAPDRRRVEGLRQFHRRHQGGLVHLGDVCSPRARAARRTSRGR